MEQGGQSNGEYLQTFKYKVGDAISSLQGLPDEDKTLLWKMWIEFTRQLWSLVETQIKTDIAATKTIASHDDDSESILLSDLGKVVNNETDFTNVCSGTFSTADAEIFMKNNEIVQQPDTSVCQESQESHIQSPVDFQTVDLSQVTTAMITRQQKRNFTFKYVSSDPRNTEEDVARALEREIVKTQLVSLTGAGSQEEEAEHDKTPQEGDQNIDEEDANLEAADEEMLDDDPPWKKKKKTNRGKRGRKPKKKSTVADKDFTCNECGQELANATSLAAHKRTHTGEKPFKCSICEKTFAVKTNMQRHEKTHSKLKPFACTQCDKSFTEKGSLKVHMRSHTGERPFVCPECGKGFAQSGILQSHMRLHTGEKDHLCTKCGKSFRQKSQLRSHALRHTDTKRFQCEHCEMKFYNAGDLQRHVLKHTGKRPFLCDLCPKTFTRLQYLKEHYNQHTGLKPYICKVCNASFRDISSYCRHEKKHKADDKRPTVPGQVAKIAPKPAPTEKTNYNTLLTSPPGVLVVQQIGDEYVVQRIQDENSTCQSNGTALLQVHGEENDFENSFGHEQLSETFTNVVPQDALPDVDYDNNEQGHGLLDASNTAFDRAEGLEEHNEGQIATTVGQQSVLEDMSAMNLLAYATTQQY